MTMLTLFKGRESTLATNQLVFSSDEVNTVDTVLEKIRFLDQKIATVDSEIEDAIKKAEIKGERLLASQREILEQRSTMRDTSIQLALEIVRRIGLQSSTPDTLIALATQSAHELAADESAKLCVHPNVANAVRDRVAHIPADEKQWLLEVVSDNSLDEADCVLKTAHGSLITTGSIATKYR